MNKKLRLLVTDFCNKDCPLCCNKNFNTNSIPVITSGFEKYDEIIITGGEPLHPKTLDKTLALIKYLKIINPTPNQKIYLYTQYPPGIINVIDWVDGLVLTINSKVDLESFEGLNFAAKGELNYKFSKKSLRLKVLKDIDIPKEIPLHMWDVVKDVVFIDNCPLPEGEDFKRLIDIS